MAGRLRDIVITIDRADETSWEEAYELIREVYDFVKPLRDQDIRVRIGVAASSYEQIVSRLKALKQ